MTMKSTDFLIQAIKESDPQFIGFLDAMFVLIDANSGDPDKKMTSKQIQQALLKFPILTMRSKLALKLYNDYQEQITETVVFPTSNTVSYEQSLKDAPYLDDTLVSDDANGELPSCEFDQAIEAENQWTEQDYADFAKDNPDTIAPKATKDYEDGIAPFKSLKSKK